MPDKIFVFDQIKKLMGWCPVCKKMAQQTEQPCNFTNIAPISGKAGNSPEFRTSNVIFPANSNLVFVLFYIGISLLLRYPGDITLFLEGIFLLNTCYYVLFLKTFEASVLADSFGASRFNPAQSSGQLLTLGRADLGKLGMPDFGMPPWIYRCRLDLGSPTSLAALASERPSAISFDACSTLARISS